MRLTIASSSKKKKKKKGNLVLINNVTHQREALSERPIEVTVLISVGNKFQDLAAIFGISCHQ